MNPTLLVKSSACLRRSARLRSRGIPSTGGQSQTSKPGVERICSMLLVQAAWSRSLCCGPRGSRRNRSATSSRGTAKPSGTSSDRATSVTYSRLRRRSELSPTFAGSNPLRPRRRALARLADQRGVAHICREALGNRLTKARGPPKGPAPQHVDPHPELAVERAEARLAGEYLFLAFQQERLVARPGHDDERLMRFSRRGCADDLGPPSPFHGRSLRRKGRAARATPAGRG